MYCIFRCSQKMEPYERLAEFCELTLRDVDLENKVLNIECQFQKTLLSDFMERITDIFLYQMERRHKDRVKWKIVHKMLNKMI